MMTDHMIRNVIGDPYNLDSLQFKKMFYLDRIYKLEEAINWNGNYNENASLLEMREDSIQIYHHILSCIDLLLDIRRDPPVGIVVL